MKNLILVVLGVISAGKVVKTIPKYPKVIAKLITVKVRSNNFEKVAKSVFLNFYHGYRFFSST